VIRLKFEVYLDKSRSKILHYYTSREKKNAFRFIDLKMDFYGFPAILQRDLQKLEIDF
jgi:hypothetical protein